MKVYIHNLFSKTIWTRVFQNLIFFLILENMVSIYYDINPLVGSGATFRSQPW